MKPAHWASLIMLILSFTCCMWLAASTAGSLLLPEAAPEGMRLRPEEVLIGMAICMIAPLTLAGASALTWWFGVRQHPLRNEPQQAPPPQHPTLVPPAASNGGRDLALEQYFGLLSELCLRQGGSPDGVQPQIQALTRQALTTLDVDGRQRVAASLQSLQLHLGKKAIGLYGVDFSGADLRFTSLRAVNLAGARLQGARLTGADLRGADLSDCDLSGADLRLACLDQARLERANLSEARLQGTSLRGAMLSHADLSRASLWRADLSEATVTRGQLTMAASLEGATLPVSDD